jgi:recombination protein RecT
MLTPIAKFRQQLDERKEEFARVLPAHIPVERFARVVNTAVSQNADLLNADRASLFMSAMKAATDGLLPDGREAALVIYRTRKKDAEGNERWVNAVQYMPMVAGILKKCRNSGELSTIVAKIVYAGDRFRNWIDDSGEHIEYEAGDDQDRDVLRCVFAMAKLKDGAIEVEVLKPADIEKIRSVSRSKDRGPWVDWWEEMAKKSAIRRLSKRLPLNTDLDDLIRRDDALYDLDGASDKRQVGGRPRQTIDAQLDALVSPPKAPAHDPQTGEIIEHETNSDSDGGPTASSEGAGEEVDPSPGESAGRTEAVSNGRPAQSNKEPARAEQAPGERGSAGAAAAHRSAPARQSPPVRKVGDDPQRDEATLADLKTEAARRAGESLEALEEFIEGIDDPYEEALIGPHVAAWRRRAKEIARKGHA